MMYTYLDFTDHLPLTIQLGCLKYSIIPLCGNGLYFPHQRINLCGDHIPARCLSDVRCYRSVCPHIQDPLKSLCIKDHRAVAQCDTSLTGSDHQMASVAVIRLPRVDHSQQIWCFLSRRRCHSFMWENTTD